MVSLPFTPVRIASVINSDWFMSEKPEIVRAGFFMLDAAWNSDPVGSLPADFTRLALICRLSVAQTQDNFTALTSGWQLVGGALTHPELTRLGAAVDERFGDELAVMAESAVVAMQGGAQEFELFNPGQIKKRAGGKTAYPSGFTPDSESLQFVMLQGYTTDEHRAWLARQFSDFSKSKDQRKSAAQWQAAYRQYAGHAYTLNNFRASDCFLAGRQSLAAPQGRALLAAVVNGQKNTPFAARLHEANSQMVENALAARRDRVMRTHDVSGHAEAPAP